MRLRSKLLVGILITMLLQMAVTGTITLTTFLVKTSISLKSMLTRRSIMSRVMPGIMQIRERFIPSPTMKLLKGFSSILASSI